MNCNSSIIKTKIKNRSIIYVIQCFFILATGNSSEILPRHNGFATILESFALNFCTINKQITISSIAMQAQTKFIFSCSKIN